ncbi:MAG: hypothetical protein PHU63_03555 [Candidatus ainarchaeum sp.]|nr:hypothetical protein [Candidatus ainarchaeum sp.]
MAKVIVRVKVYSENPEEIDSVNDRIKNIIDVKESKLEEIGFGIKIIKLILIADESEGLEKIETDLSNVEGVSQVEIESVDRALG